MNDKVLITGCGRSGTKYITFALQRLGLDVRHERMGRDGIASWYMAVDASHSPFGPTRRGTDFRHVFHQVRHPLAVIASAVTLKEESWRFVCEHAPIEIDEPPTLRAAKYWYYWNLEAERIAHWRYRVEDPGALQALCEWLGLDFRREAVEHVSTAVNTRSDGRLFHWYEELCGRFGRDPDPSVGRWLKGRARKSNPPPTVSWQDMRSIDAELTELIRTKAIEYGYDVPGR
jgi:hypothetical protein